VLKEMINELHRHGAEAVILGCTDLPLLLHQNEVDIELINSSKILAEAAVRFAVEP